MLPLFITLLLFSLKRVDAADAKVGIPGTECLFGGICSGGSVCIDVLCLCVDGQRELDGKCVEESFYERQVKESESLQDDKPVRLPSIGLAGHPCGQGGVCRPSTKCIEGTCKCRQGYNPSFGECIRDLNGAFSLDPLFHGVRRCGRCVVCFIIHHILW